jgi:Mrp family chromosome partitioning ATPase
MKVFLVKRTDRVGYVEDFAMVVVAEDELTAERRARWSSNDFKKAKLSVLPVDLNTEAMILKANTGA